MDVFEFEFDETWFRALHKDGEIYGIQVHAVGNRWVNVSIIAFSNQFFDMIKRKIIIEEMDSGE